RRIRPQILERVVLARRRVEEVHDYVAVVLHDPLARLVTLDAEPVVADRVQGGVDLFRQGVDLPAAIAGRDHKKVVQRSDSPHVQHDDVTGFVVEGDASAKAGTIQGGRQLKVGFAAKGGGAQWTSFTTECGNRRPERRNVETLGPWRNLPDG